MNYDPFLGIEECIKFSYNEGFIKGVECDYLLSKLNKIHDFLVDYHKDLLK